MSKITFASVKHKLKHLALRPKWQGIKRKPRSMNNFSDFFSLLSLLPSYEIDPKKLESAYFREQRLYHPDRFIGKEDAERIAALQRSADINNAYDTLKDPLKRAQYLLLSQGIFVGTERDSVKPSQELLIEFRESIEEAKTPNELFKIADQLEEEHQRLQRMISVAYDAEEWNKMAQLLLKLSYVNKTLEDIRKQKLHFKGQ